MRSARYRVKTKIRYDVFLKTYHERIWAALKAKYHTPLFNLIYNVLNDDIDIICDEIHARHLKAGTKND